MQKKGSAVPLSRDRRKSQPFLHTSQMNAPSPFSAAEFTTEATVLQQNPPVDRNAPMPYFVLSQLSCNKSNLHDIRFS